MFKVCILDIKDGTELEQKLNDMKKEGYELINLQPHKFKNIHSSVKSAMQRQPSKIIESYICIFENKTIN